MSKIRIDWVKKNEGDRMPIFARNFSGEPTDISPAGGVRTFCLSLDPAMAEELAADGWNVKYSKSAPQDDPRPYLPVTVSYRKYAPKILLKTKLNNRPIFEDEVGDLDDDIFNEIKMVISSSHWTMNGRSGVKAYLEKLICTVDEDDIDTEYEAAMGAMSNEPAEAEETDNNELPF